jgi:hypothetical protein
LADLLWVFAGLGTSAVLLAASYALTLLRRRRWRAAYTAPLIDGTAPDHHLELTIEDAERRMAVLLRRMRAHLRDPYDFAVSRISSEAAFEDCLDRAAALGTRIAELGGAAPASQAEHERMRGLILESVMTGQGVTVIRTTPRSGREKQERRIL